MMVVYKGEEAASWVVKLHIEDCIRGDQEKGVMSIAFVANLSSGLVSLSVARDQDLYRKRLGHWKHVLGRAPTGLEVVFANRYHMIKSLCRVCVSLTGPLLYV